MRVRGNSSSFAEVLASMLWVNPTSFIELSGMHAMLFMQAARYLQEATAQEHLSRAKAASTAQAQLDQALAASKATAADQDDLQKAIQASQATAAAASAAPVWAAGLPSEQQQLAMLVADGQLQQEQDELQAPPAALQQPPPPKPLQQQRTGFGSARLSPPLLHEVEGAGFGCRPGSSGGLSPGQRIKGCQGLLDREAQRLAKM
jgi:hypothetical protein